MDTDIASYLLRGSPEAQLAAPHLEGRVSALSFQTVGELRYGAIRSNWGELKRQSLEEHIRRFAVLTADDETVLAWAELKSNAEALGRAKATADLWIAATAKRHSLPLLTGDRGFLSALEIEVINIRAGT